MPPPRDEDGRLIQPAASAAAPLNAEVTSQTANLAHNPQNPAGTQDSQEQDDQTPVPTREQQFDNVRRDVDSMRLQMQLIERDFFEIGNSQKKDAREIMELQASIRRVEQTLNQQVTEQAAIKRQLEEILQTNQSVRYNQQVTSNSVYQQVPTQAGNAGQDVNASAMNQESYRTVTTDRESLHETEHGPW